MPKIATIVFHKNFTMRDERVIEHDSFMSQSKCLSKVFQASWISSSLVFFGNIMPTHPHPVLDPLNIDLHIRCSHIQ